MFVFIKDYDFCVVTKKMLEKDEFLADISSCNSNIKHDIEKVLDNNGYVVGLEKKNILKLVYLFELKENVLVFKKKILTDEITEETKNKFENIVTEELKEKLIFDELEKIDWNDIEIKHDKKAGFSFVVFAICFVIGLIFDNVGFGILFGFILGLTSGTVIVQKKKNNKNSKKKKNNKKEQND